MWSNYARIWVKFFCICSNTLHSAVTCATFLLSWIFSTHLNMFCLDFVYNCAMQKQFASCLVWTQENYFQLTLWPDRFKYVRLEQIFPVKKKLLVNGRWNEWRMKSRHGVRLYSLGARLWTVFQHIHCLPCCNLLSSQKHKKKVQNLLKSIP